jgi:hypothetical protein
MKGRKVYFYHSNLFHEHKHRPIVVSVKATIFKTSAFGDEPRRMLRVFRMFRHNLQLPSSGLILLVGHFRQPHVVSAVGDVLCVMEMCGAEEEQASTQYERLDNSQHSLRLVAESRTFTSKCSRENLETRTTMCTKISTERVLCTYC